MEWKNESHRKLEWKDENQIAMESQEKYKRASEKKRECKRESDIECTSWNKNGMTIKTRDEWTNF